MFVRNVNDPPIQRLINHKRQPITARKNRKMASTMADQRMTKIKSDYRVVEMKFDGKKQKRRPQHRMIRH